MPAIQWQTFLTDLGDLLSAIGTTPPADWSAFFAKLGKLLDNVLNVAPTEKKTALNKLRAAIPTASDPTARDWAGFFAALAAFTAQVLPLILPLFGKPTN